MAFNPTHIPIGAHAQFCSDETGAPFQRCLLCECSLVEPGQGYVVEKAYRRHVAYDAEELVFEFALCLACYASMIERFSAHSLRQMEAFYAEHLDTASRRARLLEGRRPAPSAWTDRCAVDGTPRAALEGYQLVAFGRGPWLQLGLAPVLIGGPAIDAMTARLSQQTKDESGRFWDEHLGPSPELRALLEDGPLPVV